MISDMHPKIMFGIHTEIAGGNAPFSAKVLKSVKNRIKMNDNKKPIAIWGPVPPRLLRAETITPINTRMQMVKGEV
jgi:hypothetical protein